MTVEYGWRSRYDVIAVHKTPEEVKAWAAGRTEKLVTIVPFDLVEKLRELVAQNNLVVAEGFDQGLYDGRCEAFEYVLELLGEPS